MERRLPDAEMHALIPSLKDAIEKCLKKHEETDPLKLTALLLEVRRLAKIEKKRLKSQES